MLFRAVLDANVLFSATVRDIFLEVALHGLYRPLWSDMILLETRDALVRTNKKSQTSADAIVTFNIGDFPRDMFSEFGIELKHPDDFLQDQLDLNPYVVTQALGGLLGYYQLPPRSAEELTSNLSRSELPRFGVALSPYLRQIDEFANSIREAKTLD